MPHEDMCVVDSCGEKNYPGLKPQPKWDEGNPLKIKLHWGNISIEKKKYLKKQENE